MLRGPTQFSDALACAAQVVEGEIVVLQMRSVDPKRIRCCGRWHLCSSSSQAGGTSFSCQARQRCVLSSPFR